MQKGTGNREQGIGKRAIRSSCCSLFPIPHSLSPAFTFIEMLIGMAITAVVLLALAGATLSVADTWVAADGSEQLDIQCAQIFNRLEHYLSPAKYIAQVQPGSLTGTGAGGSLFYWAVDNYNGVADEAPQLDEMAYIVHDPVAQTLWLWQPIPLAQMNTTQLADAATTLTNAEFTNASWVTTFKSISSATPLGHNVTGATFAVDDLTSTTQRPMVEITLALNRAPQPTATQYNAIMLRAPDTQPTP
jgi:hypothetical protein